MRRCPRRLAPPSRIRRHAACAADGRCRECAQHSTLRPLRNAWVPRPDAERPRRARVVPPATLLGWRSNARRSSSGTMPQPLSATRMSARRLAISTATFVSPASSILTAFDDGRWPSMTSPAGSSPLRAAPHAERISDSLRLDCTSVVGRWTREVLCSRHGLSGLGAGCVWVAPPFKAASMCSRCHNDRRGRARGSRRPSRVTTPPARSSSPHPRVPRPRLSSSAAASWTAP